MIVLDASKVVQFGCMKVHPHIVQICEWLMISPQVAIHSSEAYNIISVNQHVFILMIICIRRDILEPGKITRLFPDEEAPPKGRLNPGTVLVKRYSIQEVVGSGGMGSVYLARDLHFPSALKQVAVKEILNEAPDTIMRNTIVQNFEREANILVSLSHPAIPKIFDYFSYNERSYLVLEYVVGQDIERILNNMTDFLPTEQIVSWAIDLCDVLDFLHTHEPEPIVFRDIKPSNVMINQYNQVVLVDFGIAKNFTFGQKGTMIGTEGYAPPEQYRGDASPLSDIYAMGATLHHLLTRRDPRLEPPFTFSDRKIRQINPAVSRELEAVVEQALEYSPVDRFSTAMEMKEALLSTARHTGMIPSNSSATISGFNGQQLTPVWNYQCNDEIRGSSSGELGVVYAGSYDQHLYAWDTLSGELKWKFAAKGGIVTCPAISKDTVFFGSEDCSVYAVDSRTGKLLWSTPTEGPVRSSPWTAQGQVFIGSDDGYLYALNQKTGSVTWRIDVGPPIRSGPILENDLVYFGNDSGEVICANLVGDVTWRFKAKRNIISMPLINQGLLYITSMDGMVYALDAKSGWSVWRFRMGKGSVSSPCVKENSLFFGSADGNIYCVDASNGKEFWRYEVHEQVCGSPIYHEGLIYCGAADGKMYSLEKKTGQLNWIFTTQGPITGRPWISEDKLFFGSADRNFYALPI
jgi:eukaryotic-like serine/threonine-protein kinase